MAPRKLRAQYAVGWIAALSIDVAAAKSMLEEEHDNPLDFKQGPSNRTLCKYTCGRIADHDAVIAGFPAGISGIGPAASTAGQMLADFSNVRVGLMVGIGGGIPRPDDDVDIRLGDIVIGKPAVSHGGVVQYDLGKVRANNEFERKGFLNAPPQALLRAWCGQLRYQHI